MSGRRVLLTAIAVPVFGTMAAAGADARPAQPLRNAADEIEVVVITARRRTERLEDVPASVSVVTQDLLDRSRVHNVNDLQFAVPSLTVAPNQSSRTSATIGMRGQYERDTVPTLDPAVGLFLDGVYVARMTGANLDFVDIERVEVVRGPQGTLFGRNTIGGAINIVPNAPRPEFGASLTAGIGNYDARDIAAVVNLPLRDERLITRIAATHRQHSGYGYNALRLEDYDDDDTQFFRAQLRIAPSERWRINLAVDSSHSSTAGLLRNVVATTPIADLITTAVGNPRDTLANYVAPYARTVLANRTGRVRSQVTGASAALHAELSVFSTRLIAAYREIHGEAYDIDQDGTPYDYGAVSERVDDQQQFSVELQAHGKALGDRLDWLAGLSGFEESGSFRQVFPLFFPANLRWQEARPAGDVSNDSFAAYVHGEHKLTPRVLLSAGVRYNEDRRQLTSRNHRRIGSVVECRLELALLDVPGTCQATLPRRSFGYVPFSLGISVKPRKTATLYATMNRGQRSGGYNLRGVTETEFGTFEPERVTSYELGAKGHSFGERLRWSVAAYKSRYDDIQLLQTDPASALLGRLLQVVRNGGEAQVRGAELDFNLVLPKLRLHGNIGLTRAGFTKLEPGIQEVTLASNFLHTPKWTGFLAADLPIQLGIGELNLHASYAWRDDVAFAYDPATLARQPAYGIANAMISLRSKRGDLGVNVWGRNLTDKRYFVRMFSGDIVTGTLGDPRTFGVSASYRLGRTAE